MSLYILRVLEYNLNEGFCLSRSAEIRQKEMPPDTGEFLYAARSGCLSRFLPLFLRCCTAFFSKSGAAFPAYRDIIQL